VATQFAAAPAADLLATQVIPLTGSGTDGGGLGKSGDGRISFGVQPSGPKAVDKRPNYTYRDLKPGQHFIDHVAIVNLNTAPLTVDVYPADAFNTLQGGFDVLSGGKKSKDLGTWIHLGHSKAQVPARSTLIMAFEVQVPRNVEPGDHAAGIVASLTTTSRDKKGNIVSVDNRTGMRVYARVVGPLLAKIGLERHEARYHSGVLNGKADVTYTVRNTGNVRLVGRQSIRVSNLFGMSSHAVDVPELPELLPGNQFSFTRPVDNVFPTFLNTAFITVDPESITGNVDPALAQVSAKTMFFALSWPGLVVIVLLVGVGGWFLWRWWRKRRAARSGPGGWGDGGAGTPTGDEPGPDTGRADGPQQPTRTPVQGAGLARRVGGLAVALLAAALAVVPTASPAHADGGALTFIPGDGTAGTPIYTVTSGPCPKTATYMVGYVYGKGLPATGAVALSKQSSVINYDGSFGIELRDNMLNIAQEFGATLQGPYKIAMQCTDPLGTKLFAEFTGTITFDTPSHFTGKVPTKAPVAGVPLGYLAVVFPEAKKQLAAQVQSESGSAPSASAKSGSSASPSTGVPPSAAAASSQAATRSNATSNLGWYVVGGIVAVVVALAGAGLTSQRRSAPAAVTQKSKTVPWPDEQNRRSGVVAGQEKTGAGTPQKAVTAKTPNGSTKGQ
jgi:hypothetical protein